MTHIEEQAEQYRDQIVAAAADHYAKASRALRAAWVGVIVAAGEENDPNQRFERANAAIQAAAKRAV